MNGELTLGENIGDLSGLAVAHRAYLIALDGKPAPEIDGFTGEQRFYLGWAQVWARKFRDDELRKRLLTDPHSPGEYRANGVVRNMAAFDRRVRRQGRRQALPAARPARTDLVRSWARPCPAKRRRSMHFVKLLLLVAAGLVLSGCGYNTIQTQDEQVTSAWSEVVNQYQRRADLIPNLVNTVKGFAAQERDVLIGVTQARAKATQTQVAVDPANPASLQQFQAAQGELSSALSRLMVVVERYPELKSDQNFRDLQAQLEGTENRITVARKRYIDSVQDYNVTIRKFPVNLTAMVFGYDVKPNFTVENEAQIARPPTVDFGTPAPAPTPAPEPTQASAPATN